MKGYSIFYLFLFVQNLHGSVALNQEIELQKVRKMAQENIKNVSSIASVENVVRLFEDDLYDQKKDLAWSTEFFNTAIAEFRKVLVNARMQQWLDEIDHMQLPTQDFGERKIPITAPMIPEEILKFRYKNSISKHLTIYDILIKRLEERLRHYAISDYILNPNHPRAKRLSRTDRDALIEAVVNDQAKISQLKNIEKAKRLLLELIEEKMSRLQTEPSSIAKKLLLHGLFAKIAEQKISEEQMEILKKFAEQQFNQAIQKKFNLAADFKQLKFNEAKTVIEIDPKETISNKRQISIDNFIEDEMTKLPERITGSMLTDMYRRIHQHLKNLAKQDQAVYMQLFEYAEPIVHSKIDQRVTAGKLIAFQ